jgi:acetyl-CoA acetyltransferase
MTLRHVAADSGSGYRLHFHAPFFLTQPVFLIAFADQSPFPSFPPPATVSQGHSSDRLAAKFGVSRKDQDEFTVLSHTRAAAAHAAGLYKVCNPVFFQLWLWTVKLLPLSPVFPNWSAVLTHTFSAVMCALSQDEIIPVDGSVVENGIKGDTNMEKVSKLSPAFIKPHGTYCVYCTSVCRLLCSLCTS